MRHSHLQFIMDTAPAVLIPVCIVFVTAFAAAGVGLGAHTDDRERQRLVNAERAAELADDERQLRSTRYSKLTRSIATTSSLRMVWAMALSGLQDAGQNGPENEVNPLIDNGMMYTTDGGARSTRSTSARPAASLWGHRSGREAPGWRAAPHEASRCGRTWSSRIFPAARDRRQSIPAKSIWDKMVASPTSSAAEDSLPHPSPPRARSSSPTAPACERGAGLQPRRENRERGLAMVRRAQAGRPRQRNLEGQKQRVEDRRRRPGRRLYDPETHLTLWGTGNPIPHRSPGVRRQPLHQLGRGAQRRCRQTPGTKYTERLVGLRRSRDPWPTPRSMASSGRSSATSRNGYYSLDRTNGKFIKGSQYVNDLNWTRASIRKPECRSNTIPSSTCRSTIPTRARGVTAKADIPTWHGGIAHQPTAYNPVRTSRTASGSRDALAGQRRVKFLSPQGIDDKTARSARTQRSVHGSVTAYDDQHKVIAKAVAD